MVTSQGGGSLVHGWNIGDDGMMRTEEKLLLKILRSALWGNSLEGDISAKEFRHVMRLAIEQTVAGLVFDVLSAKTISVRQQQLMDCIGMSMEIERLSRMADKEVAEMARAFDAVGMDYLVVKGQTIACLYPKPLLRQSGDIDYLVRDDYCIARPLSERALGVKLPEKMLEREVGFEKNGVPYELHTSLRTFASRKHQKAWDALMTKEWQEYHFVAINGQKVRVLSPTVLVAYVFIHLFFHIVREGVSLRQLCDWTIVLHHYRDEVDRHRLLGIMDSLGMTEGFRAFGAIVVDELGLCPEDFPVELSRGDRRWKEILLADIFAGGNFGKLHHKADSSWRFKMETMRIAVRNSVKYRKLAPMEVGLLIPRLLRGNALVLMKKLF